MNLFDLKENLHQNFSETIWGKILLKEFENKLIESKIKLEGINKRVSLFPELERFEITLTSDMEKIQNIINSTKKSWDKTYELVQNLKFDTWPRNKVDMELKEEAKLIRDTVKKDIEGLIKKIFVYNSEQANLDIYSMYETLKGIKRLVEEFGENYTLKKREKNIIDFSDIEHLALQILVKKNDEGEYAPTQIAESLKEKFVEIAIDEYQDSNLVQEYILNSVSNGHNIFMVGDVKQSIYRFRQAKPELFIDKYENYNLVNTVDNYDVGEKIQLFKNFRSRKNILDCTNMIFENIMTKELGDIDYTKDEFLNLGAKYDETDNKDENQFAGKTQVHILDLAESVDLNEIQEEINEDDEEEEVEPIENTLLEAKFVAKKINELINSGFKVYDKKIGYRNLEYKDIVILLRATSVPAPIFEKELLEQNIPVFSDASLEYLESTEIQTIISVLKILNNPLQDIPLITVLRSVIGNFTDNDLIEIRLADRSESFYVAMLKARTNINEKTRKKIDDFILKLENWKEKQEYISLDELIWQIYMDTNYYNYVGLLTNGKLRQANLKMLFEKAKEYETVSFKGLYNFINFIDKLKKSNSDTGAAKIIGENDNVVRIMSIHKSKGLEFPVVFLSGTAKKINMRDLNENILMHQELGFGPKYINYDKRIEYNTLAKEALKIKLKNESISEEMRVLYVALTRAKEQLIITGISKDLNKEMIEKRELLKVYNQEKVNVNLLKKYATYLDWIELVYLNNQKEMDNIMTIYHNRIKDVEIRKKENIGLDILTRLNNKIESKEFKIDNETKTKLQWEYDYKDSEKILTKTSVSKIKQEKNNEKGIKAFLIEERDINLVNKKEDIESNDVNNEELLIPKFIKEKKISAGEKGTLIHLCFKNLNINKEYSSGDVKEFIEELKYKNIINQKEQEAINIDVIYKFTKSQIYKELKKAREVHREEPFYLNISAKEIYQNENLNENILVQGIIDLYYINEMDELILVDYKTDKITEVEGEKILKERYIEQLNLYKAALEKSLNRKVDKIIIYSTTLNKEILI